MERHQRATMTMTAAVAAKNHDVEDYATSFQNEQLQQQDLFMMYHDHLQPDHASLHPYPASGTIERQPPPRPRTDTLIHQDQLNYHRLQGGVESPTNVQQQSPPDTFCNLRATNVGGNAVVQHHQQQQQLQQQRQSQQLLIPQQQQHRIQQALSPSQYLLYNQAGRMNQQRHQQQMQYQQQHLKQQQHQNQQPQHLPYPQFADSQQSYYPQDQTPYPMDQINNSDYRIGVHPEQNQILYHRQDNHHPRQQSIATVATGNSHIYSAPAQTSKQAAPETILLDGHHNQHRYHQMSANFSDRDISSQMSAGNNPYSNNDQQLYSQSSSATSLGNRNSQNPAQDSLAAATSADQASQYMAHLKQSDLDLIPAAQSSVSNDDTMIMNQRSNSSQTMPPPPPATMAEYSSQTAGSNGGLSHCQMQGLSSLLEMQQSGPQVQQQQQQRQNNLIINGNPAYRTQVIHNNYGGCGGVQHESAASKDPAQASYVSTMRNGSTSNNVVLHHHPQAAVQRQQQQQHLQLNNDQAYYGSSARGVMSNSGRQQAAPVVIGGNNNMSSSSSPVDNFNSNSNGRALFDRPETETRKQQDDYVDLKSTRSVSQDWLDTICRHLIDHMNRFGICVIDNFLGRQKGDQIFKEVLQLYSNGQHSRGGLVNSNKLSSQSLGADAGVIRNDRVIWIDGYEDGCTEINNLIQTLCSVITNSARLSLYSNNGLDKIVINKRTKAHVACYPGNGTRYIKHVDNPNGDGRVITSIYYLNKNWNTTQDGGLLRMFPTGINEVANIEPLFDRVLFFWSDRRNPHEVLPAYRDRFAITVWYIGENRSG